MKFRIVLLVAAALAGEAHAQQAEPGSQPAGTPVVRGADQVGNAPSSSPFRYTVAVEPAREPYRRPVPCSTFARETDGTTTCIGTQSRSYDAPSRAASREPRERASREKRAEHRAAPVQRPVPERLTDPRFDLAPPMPPPGGGDGNGFLAFLGRVLFR